MKKKSPVIEALVFFYPKGEEKESLPKGFLTDKQNKYRPHLVVDGNDQRVSRCNENNIATEHYLGVQFCDGPEEIPFNVPVEVRMELLYYPKENYQSLVPGAKFTIREGPYVVGSGEVLQWIYRSKRNSELDSS